MEILRLKKRNDSKAWNFQYYDGETDYLSDVFSSLM